MADRREITERRTSAERRRQPKRRNSNDRFAAIEITSSDLHVAVLDRTAMDTPDLVHVEVIPWRFDAMSLNSDLGQRELSEAFRSIAQEYQLHTAQLNLVLGGEFCVTKAIRGMKEEVRSELQQIKLRSRLYLMLGPGEKVSVSNSWPIDARHEYAVAATCNQQTLEVIHAAATNAGVKVERIEPALVSISRVIGRIETASDEPSLVVHLSRNTTELGICHNSKLLLDYRPGGITETEGLVEIVRTHLNRLQRHVGRQLHEAPPELKQIYLCGDQEIVDVAYQEFLACDRFKVHRIEPQEIQATWEFTSNGSDSSAVPTLGTLLSTYLPENSRDAPDFMDHVLASTRMPIGPILVRSIMPLVAVMLVACGFIFANYQEQLAVDSMHRKVDALLPAEGRARELRLKLASSQAKLKQLSHLSTTLHSLPAQDVISRIGHCMPSDVWLTGLVLEDMQAVKISGMSYLEAGVFDFVRWLEQSPYFRDVALEGTRPGQSSSGLAINFNVELSLNEMQSPVKEVASNE